MSLRGPFPGSSFACGAVRLRGDKLVVRTPRPRQPGTLGEEVDTQIAVAAAARAIISGRFFNKDVGSRAAPRLTDRVDVEGLRRTTPGDYRRNVKSPVASVDPHPGDVVRHDCFAVTPGVVRSLPAPEAHVEIEWSGEPSLRAEAA